MGCTDGAARPPDMEKMSTAMHIGKTAQVGLGVFALPAALIVASSMMLWLGHRRRRSVWLPMSSFKEKRDKMLEDSTIDQLMVITDFDATITTGDSEQCHDLLGASKILTKNFRKDFAPLLDWSTNPATDGVQWWDRAHSIMLKHGQPPRYLLPRLVRSATMHPRPGSLKLLQRLAALKVPVLIVSAGLSDVIEEFLRMHDALTENVTVCSNRLNYGADSAPQSVCPEPPITSFTKATAYRASRFFFRQHCNRRTLLVLGDSCSDVDSAQNVPYDHLISIGFLNSKPFEEAPRHAEAFDALVLGDQGSLAGVDALVDDIAGKKKKIFEEMRRIVSAPDLTTITKL